MYALYKALNKYTSHDARLITFKKTYLDYQTDIFDPTLNKIEEMVEWADFFILGEVLAPRMHTEPILNAVNKNNCIVRAGGSIARGYPQLYMTRHYKNIMKTGSAHDFSIFQKIHPIAPTVNLYDFSLFPPENKEYEPPYKIVFSGTALKREQEHSGYFKEACIMLSKKYTSDMIDFVNIHNTSWNEALKIKSECHIAFDQHSIGAYANSAIESMYFSQPVFCKVSGWCKCYHPDVPTLNTDSPISIYQKVLLLIERPEEMKAIGKAGHDFVMRTHSAEIAVKKWEELIRYVSEEYRKS